MNLRIILFAIIAAFALSGCDLYGYGLVFKSTLDKAVLEKKGVEDNLKAANLVKEAAEKELEKLKKNPPKPEEIFPSLASCKALIDTAVANAVANKICQAPALAPTPAKKSVVKNNKPKTPYINKAASGGKKLILPQEKVYSKDGEICRLRSNGTARLISAPSMVLAHGHVIAISLPDQVSPDARYLPKILNEDCDTWRKRVGDKLVDRTDGSSRK